MSKNSKFTILFDEPQEAQWFRSLHHAFSDIEEEPINHRKTHSNRIRAVLAYDRPDIVLLDHNEPILSVEQTVEVPSGHNVGQRFARIAASAELCVPFLYFCPYVAKKHGGETAGPRYMNARLFKALEVVERVTGSAITTINWLVDENFEVRRDSEKDSDVRDYMNSFLELYDRTRSSPQLVDSLLKSDIHTRMVAHREAFVRDSIRRPEQYDSPPNSVKILNRLQFRKKYNLCEAVDEPLEFDEVVVYEVGARYLRSDPYTGMAMLYRYLYVVEFPSRIFVLWFPHISGNDWDKAAKNPQRKDIRLFRLVADAAIFQLELFFQDNF